MFGVATLFGGGAATAFPGTKAKSISAAATAVPQSQQPQFLQYTVKKGNTLHFIAKHFGVSVDDIVKYNPEVTNGLKKGQELRIPNPDYKAPVAVTATAPAATGQPAGKHTVKAGETLFSISKLYGCEVAQLVKLNPDAAQNLKTGMQLTLPAGVQAQTVEAAKPVAGDGVYQVEAGDTFWSLERKFQTTREVLIAMNPSLNEGLKTGMSIRVPAGGNGPTDNSGSGFYTVQKGETIYSLATRFHLSVGDLIRANPALETRGLVEGEAIKIPARSMTGERALPSGANPVTRTAGDSSLVVPADCNPDPDAPFDTYRVAVLLPFYLTANDTINRNFYNPEISGQRADSGLTADEDSTGTARPTKKVYPRSESFVQFYEGVLLAVDSLRQAGMKVKLYAYDTNQNSSSVQTILKKPEMRTMNLIIGPVFPEIQAPVAEFARQNRIPMVSPLSAAGEFEAGNPYYLKVNPSKEYLLEQTARYVSSRYADANLIILRTGSYQNLPEGKLVSAIRETRAASGGSPVREYDILSRGARGLDELMSADQQNVFVIPSETEAQVSIALGHLNTLSEKYPVTLIGLSAFQRFKSVQTEYYHRIRMNLLSPYYVDYQTPVVDQFVRKFRKNYASEPTQFSFQGYDISFYFLSAMFSYGKNYLPCLPAHRAGLTQGEFYFGRMGADGGYMNRGLFILNYEPDYSIRMGGVVGVPGR